MWSRDLLIATIKGEIMVKCKYCGEMNLEDSKYCARCGQELPKNDNSAMKDTLNKAQKGFDKDSLATLERSRITYVCTVCGNINSIEQDRCAVCGKPRPRSEFVAALRKLKQSGNVREEMPSVDNAPQQMNEEIPKEAEEQQATQPAPVMNYAQSASGGQLPATVQPFVVVPFVNTQQPLWQYRQNQVYRFQPYTQEEIREMQEAQAKASAVEEVPQREDFETDYVLGKKRVRVCSILTLILALATLLCMYFVPYTKSAIADPAMFYVAGIISCLSAVGMPVTDKTIAYEYQGWYSFLPPILLALAMILLAILVIRSVIRIVTGKAKVKGFILPLMIFLFVVGALVVLIEQLIGLKAFVQFFSFASIGTYLIPVLAILLVIVGLCNKANVASKRKKKQPKQ